MGESVLYRRLAGRVLCGYLGRKGKKVHAIVRHMPCMGRGSRLPMQVPWVSCLWGTDWFVDWQMYFPRILPSHPLLLPASSATAHSVWKSSSSARVMFCIFPQIERGSLHVHMWAQRLPLTFLWVCNTRRISRMWRVFVAQEWRDDSRATAKNHDHDKCMRSSDLESIYKSISHASQNGEEATIVGIEKDARGHCGTHTHR